MWKVEKRYITKAEFNSRQSLLAVSVENELSIWDTINSRKVHAFTIEFLGAFALSPNGRVLATAALDNTITLWDIEAEKQIIKFSAHNAPVSSLAFGASEKALASGSDDGTVCFWDATRGNLRGTLIPGSAGWILTSLLGDTKYQEIWMAGSGTPQTFADLKSVSWIPSCQTPGSRKLILANFFCD